MAEQPRKLWLDWQRGLAVLYMVEWHTYDAWRADAVAVGGLHDAIVVVGGFAAPSFLYMAGMSQLLADAAAERKGATAGDRRLHALRRAFWLLGVAYAFRFVEYVLGGAWRVPGGWRSILRVDVLNVIAVTLILGAILAVGRRRQVQVVLATLGAAAVAVLSPVVGGWQRGPSRLFDYLFTTDAERGIFYLFPWAAFGLAGFALGRLAAKEPRPVLWMGLGVALFGGGWLAETSLPPFYAYQDFWKTSPLWFSMRLGLCVVTSGLLQLLPASADRWLSWLRTLGRHSLLGYFISVELPYGTVSASIHRRLSMPTVLLGIVLMSVVTWAAAALADRHDARKAARARTGVPPSAHAAA